MCWYEYAACLVVGHIGGYFIKRVLVKRIKL